jgi:hypothetical protein
VLKEPQARGAYGIRDVVVVLGLSTRSAGERAYTSTPLTDTWISGRAFITRADLRRLSLVSAHPRCAARVTHHDRKIFP